MRADNVMDKGHVKRSMLAILLDMVYQGFEEQRGQATTSFVKL